MEVSILVHGEQITEAAFRRFQDGVFDGEELVVNELRIRLFVV